MIRINSCCFQRASHCAFRTAATSQNSIRHFSNNGPPSSSNWQQTAKQQFGRFWRWTTQERPHWTSNAQEAVVACSIFAFTGSFTMVAVRPALKSVFGIEGSLWDGPNEYRVLSILCISPIYSIVLLVTGTLLGRHRFFADMTFKMWNRLLPSAVTRRLLCVPAKERRFGGSGTNISKK